MSVIFPPILSSPLPVPLFSTSGPSTIPVNAQARVSTSTPYCSCTFRQRWVRVERCLQWCEIISVGVTATLSSTPPGLGKCRSVMIPVLSTPPTLATLLSQQPSVSTGSSLLLAHHVPSEHLSASVRSSRFLPESQHSYKLVTSRMQPIAIPAESRSSSSPMQTVFLGNSAQVERP